MGSTVRIGGAVPATMRMIDGRSALLPALLVEKMLIGELWGCRIAALPWTRWVRVQMPSFTLTANQSAGQSGESTSEKWRDAWRHWTCAHLLCTEIAQGCHCQCVILCNGTVGRAFTCCGPKGGVDKIMWTSPEWGFDCLPWQFYGFVDWWSSAADAAASVGSGWLPSWKHIHRFLVPGGPLYSW